MHELSIAAALLEQVLSVASSNNARRVLRVELELGAQRLVLPEALQTAFALLSEGSLAEGAVLDLLEVVTRARCRSCAEHFAPKINDYRCPSCGVAAAELIDGDDLILRSVSVEAD